MKENTIPVVTCLLSILLLTLHITDDIVRGISKAEPSNIALVVLVVFLYGTLLLAGRRSGYVVMLLVRSEEHTSELQSLAYLVCRLLLEKKKNKTYRLQVSQ